MYATKVKGVRYLEMAEGYVTRIALDKDDTVIGYEYVQLGKMMDAVNSGMSADEAMKKFTSSYGRFKEGVKFINPRHE